VHRARCHADAVKELASDGAVGATSLKDFVTRLPRPRPVWLMVPAAVVDRELETLVPLLEPGDIVIDGGNSYYHDDLRHAARLKSKAIYYVDVGTSGGVWGLERGYCQMIGGEREVVQYLDPIFSALAPGLAAAPRTVRSSRNRRTGLSALWVPRRRPLRQDGPQRDRVRHHGGLSEGLNILRHAGVGKRSHEVDAETTPLRNPEHYQYQLDLSEIAEVWRRGSVIGSWLLDLTASALHSDPDLKRRLRLTMAWQSSAAPWTRGRCGRRRSTWLWRLALAAHTT